VTPAPPPLHMRASSVRRAAATRAAIIPALARRMTAAPHHVAMAEAAGAGRRGASSLTAAAADARSASASASAQQQQRQNKNQPILLLDVMDTLVSDPFYEAMPRHFNMPFRDLLAQKHPTAWLEFERGEIAEDALLRKFFADGRVVDGAALVAMMRQHYRLLDGIEPLLDRLKARNVEMHACSNYPVWWRNVEGETGLSRWLEWTFVSCEGPMRVESGFFSGGGIRRAARFCSRFSLFLPFSSALA